MDKNTRSLKRNYWRGDVACLQRTVLNVYYTSQQWGRLTKTSGRRETIQFESRKKKKITGLGIYIHLTPIFKGSEKWRQNSLIVSDHDNQTSKEIYKPNQKPDRRLS